MTTEREALEAARQLLSDVREMQEVQENGDVWFGGFSYWTMTDDLALIDWPNLKISADKLENLLGAL
jgi:hypothetical protein